MMIYRFVAILLTAMMFAFNCEGQFDEGLGDDNQQEVPADPENPDTPGDPETPGEPEDPDTPSEPDTPQEPDKPDTPAEPENPAEPEGPVYYVKVNQDYSDWSGDYLITYTESSSIKVFDSWDPYGQSKTDLGSSLTANGIPAEVADKYKAVVSKIGDYYSIYVSGIDGYIGYTSTNNSLALSDTAPTTDSKYLWNFSYKEGKNLWLQVSHNTGRRLQWNSSAPRFACYTGGQNEITLYRRTVSTGSVPPGQPDTPTEPEQPTEPDTPVEPDQPSQPDQPTEPDTPSTPTTGSSGKYGYYELPVMNLKEKNGYLVDANNENLYYAYHHCAGGEKGPNNTKARNYTVCFSADHHVPMWVAGPRHSCYEGSSGRNDSYKADPSIPASIQYSSKSTGGDCNKGHMMGSAERTISVATNKQVFYYSNIAPQYSNTFNIGGGAWNNLEDHIDDLVCSDTLYVVIGTYFEKFTDKRGNTATPKRISFGGRNDVSCPTMFYYALLRTKKGNTKKPLSQCSKDDLQCVAIVKCHEASKGDKPAREDLMSISDLEKLTGFTYFPNVPQAPKDSYNASDWL